MAYEYSPNDEMYFGLSGETKPANAGQFEKTMELDTGKIFIYKDGVWYEL
jgi:hypothetical protein